MIDPQDIQRTSQQNKALHLYCEMVADSLNAGGLDMKAVLKPEIDIPWSKDTVKRFLWKPIMEAMIEKESTTEANTTEYNKVYEVLHRHLAEKLGVSVLWPHHSMQGFEEHWSKE